ncbi:hypothetical protein ACFV4P_34135 [Kitasatospora sp. NPDC059795]|uniref:hypothetical protein n=1 Tax=Kitasatospora sp. NPDC059795 TaxID=3346949 RepID=UPI0036632D09
MPSDAPQLPGRVRVGLYFVSAAGDPDGVLERNCRQHAEAREWVVAGGFTDSAVEIALAEREGWLALVEALERGEIQGVLTWNRAMVADTSEEWDRLAAILADRGGFLVSCALNTPGQSLYGRSLTNAPSGTPRAAGRRIRSDRPSSREA